MRKHKVQTVSNVLFTYITLYQTVCYKLKINSIPVTTYGITYDLHTIAFPAVNTIRRTHFNLCGGVYRISGNSTRTTMLTVYPEESIIKAIVFLSTHFVHCKF